MGGGRKRISVRTFHIYCPIWVKFGVERDLQVMLLSIYEFPTNRHRGRPYFLTGVNELHLRRFKNHQLLGILCVLSRSIQFAILLRT